MTSFLAEVSNLLWAVVDIRDTTHCLMGGRKLAVAADILHLVFFKYFSIFVI